MKRCPECGHAFRAQSGAFTPRPSVNLVGRNAPILLVIRPDVLRRRPACAITWGRNRADIAGA